MAPKDRILISDPRIVAIPIRENSEKLVDLILDYPGIFANRIKTDPKEIEKSFSKKVRRSVAEKLVEASKLLPDGVKFHISEGFRPLDKQKEYFEGYSLELSKTHPEWDKERVYKEASKYVSPPEIVPPHSTGGAVDLTLVGKEGELDMGSRLNSSSEENYKDSSFTLYPGLTSEQRKNRELLMEVLEEEGFVNYPFEWWHWSYGDRYWAYHRGEEAALYGSAESF